MFAKFHENQTNQSGVYGEIKNVFEGSRLDRRQYCLHDEHVFRFHLKRTKSSAVGSYSEINRQNEK